jgi:hypothetical protein
MSSPLWPCSHCVPLPGSPLPPSRPPRRPYPVARPSPAAPAPSHAPPRWPCPHRAPSPAAPAPPSCPPGGSRPPRWLARAGGLVRRWPRARAPVAPLARGPARPLRLTPHPRPARPTPRPRGSAPRTPVPRVPAAVRPGGPVACPGEASRAPGARARNCSCTTFDFQLYPFFNFSLVDVSCHALHRATIQFKFIFVNDLCRALRRTTFRFKFSSVDVCRRAFHRATLNVSL